MRKIINFTALAAIFITFSTLPLPGTNIKLIKKTPISHDTVLLEEPNAFCVTEDNLFLIPDSKAGDIKIYNDKGKLVKVLGRKGLGPGEFEWPAFCFYNKEDHKFGVMDFGVRKIFIYECTGPTSFERVKEVYCLGGAFDIQLKGSLLFISGYKAGENQDHYEFYNVNLTDNQTTMLLPSYYKYGLKSFREYQTQFINKSDIAAVGMKAFFDIQDGDVFFVWEGDLKIIKSNATTEKMHFFGQKTPHYIKPSPSKKLLDSFQSGDFKTAQGEWDKMSYINNIFANSHNVFVVYNEPVNSGDLANLWLQAYTLDGNFIDEVLLPGKPDSKMWFDKEREILYSLGSEPVDKLDEEYFVLEYKIDK